MEIVTLIGRASALSLLQMQKVKLKIEAVFPNIQVEIIPKESKGDMLQNVPLQTVEGSDFFTQDIYQALQKNEADIAVHSLKDMSAEHFFGDNYFSVVDRNDVRDIAIFNADIIEKLKLGSTIIIGTCSPRREVMAIDFLAKALPQYNGKILITTKVIRGNVDTRLQKLNNNEYDGIILATAGINRLLESEDYSNKVKELLANKRLMLLPLIECAPAPCQGAIVAEAISKNTLAVDILKSIKNELLHQQCVTEKTIAKTYGIGCMQKFGVVTINYTENDHTIYAAGLNNQQEVFSKWYFNLPLYTTDKNIFSSTDYMGSFFDYSYPSSSFIIEQPVVYVANYKAVYNDNLVSQLMEKQVWAAGTKTWFQLAKQNIWVTGCADGFGLNFLESVWQYPTTKVSKQHVCVLTNTNAQQNWQTKGWNTLATYELHTKESISLNEKISKANFLFWTSIHQYHQYKDCLLPNAIYACPSGETATLLKEQGINPIIFPNIKAFVQWKQSITQ